MCAKIKMKTIPASVLIIAVTILVLHSTCSCCIINDILSEEGEYGKVHNNTKQENNNKAVNFKSKMEWIVPGTKWCGPGNISKSYDDLGLFYKTDSCCREHDYCDDCIVRGKTKYGLENTGRFTLSHCDCDRKFYKCLKKVGTIISKFVGFDYFTIWGPKCFKQDYPIVTCLKRERGRCVNYILNEGSKEMYQWFDNPKF